MNNWLAGRSAGKVERKSKKEKLKVSRLVEIFTGQGGAWSDELSVIKNMTLSLRNLIVVSHQKLTMENLSVNFFASDKESDSKKTG